MRWLIVLDGTERAANAAAFARPMMVADDEVVFFLAEEAAANIPKKLADDYAELKTSRVHRPGTLTDSLEEIVTAEPFDIVVYGSRGRRGLSRLLLGSVAAHLEHRLDCSLLVFRGAVRPVKKILVATGLYEEQTSAVDLGGTVAARTGAFVTILHVMSQVPLIDDAAEKPLEADAGEAIEEGTLEGELIRGRLARLEALGLAPQAVLRHGLVVDEIRAEFEEGDYDLLVAGAHRIPEDLPFGGLLTRDMADEILMNTQGAVLIA